MPEDSAESSVTTDHAHRLDPPMYCPDCDRYVREVYDRYDERFRCPECGVGVFESKDEYIEIVHTRARFNKENGWGPWYDEEDDEEAVTDGGTVPGANDFDVLLDEGEVREKRDGVEYVGPHWFVTLMKRNEDDQLEFHSAETAVPVEDLPDETSEKAIEKAKEAGIIHNGEWAQRVERATRLPDAIYEAVEEEGFSIAHRSDQQDLDDTDPEDWLYDGECPNCGDALCIERLGDTDVCYDCGAEVSA